MSAPSFTAILNRPTSRSHPNSVNFKYDVAPDGKRFLVERVYIPVEQHAAAPPIKVLMNWQAAMKP
jgi:hypothetical protein